MSASNSAIPINVTTAWHSVSRRQLQGTSCREGLLNWENRPALAGAVHLSSCQCYGVTLSLWPSNWAVDSQVQGLDEAWNFNEAIMIQL
jgi:hypothetical protein